MFEPFPVPTAMGCFSSSFLGSLKKEVEAATAAAAAVLRAAAAVAWFLLTPPNLCLTVCWLEEEAAEDAVDCRTFFFWLISTSESERRLFNAAGVPESASSIEEILLKNTYIVQIQY